jgi:hypothetical protein
MLKPKRANVNKDYTKKGASKYTRTVSLYFKTLPDSGIIYIDGKPLKKINDPNGGTETSCDYEFEPLENSPNQLVSKEPKSKSATTSRKTYNPLKAINF